MSKEEMTDYILRSGNALKIFKTMILYYGPEDAVELTLTFLPEEDQTRILERAYNSLH